MTGNFFDNDKKDKNINDNEMKNVTGGKEPVYAYGQDEKTGNGSVIGDGSKPQKPKPTPLAV